jgi:AcrR family transcriptional regulator
MATPAGTPAHPVTDGRRARRQRGRQAVIDATLDLVFEGHVPPTVEQIAHRAGVSAASVFRYFDTLDDLRNATTEVYFDRHADLLVIPDIGDGSLATRIDNFVSSRVTLYESHEPMARLIRLRAHDQVGAAQLVHRLRATRADQVRQHFDAELGQMTPAVRDDAAMVVATLTSFEAWDQARHDHERSAAQVRRAWIAALTKVLGT